MANVLLIVRRWFSYAPIPRTLVPSLTAEDIAERQAVERRLALIEARLSISHLLPHRRQDGDPW